ncbi:MAG: hypothetical protein IAI50_03920, partial [Candidatus Eremiobacteraeota bacterium]|nr:hypothetical protein [Candidatus Eremiobacteraeota bacterium]
MMLEIPERPAIELTPTGRVTTWLRSFEDALTRSDVDAATALFAATC